MAVSSYSISYPAVKFKDCLKAPELKIAGANTNNFHIGINYFQK
ncbi:hypothetical protein LDG_5727 [Legionella drancourtii LLAP12]|uniref:Uncharacterized protein n=1 Tax=Legionella drancourtii LLAP12 TaxID=658187 RepID=G9EKJ2_9GAMM|nr:hypothetical protein LDG_5727 [Legionella drancourtii LLAP12]